MRQPVGPLTDDLSPQKKPITFNSID